jgi:hypothetical protein
MKAIFSVALLTVFFCASCRRDEEAIPPETAPTTTGGVYIPLTIGNYWIYQITRIDTNGVETIDPVLDSVYVKKDSIINGQVYSEVWNRPWPDCPSCKTYLRDSAGFILDCHGEKHFAPFFDYYFLSFDTIPNYASWYDYMIDGDSVITVPAGTFATAVKQEIQHAVPAYNWDNPRYNCTFYCNGVGIVMEENYYSGSPDNFVAKLVRWHLE